MPGSAAVAALRNFDARVIADPGISYLVVGGLFSPTHSIDLRTQTVILSVGQSKRLRLTLPAGSFKESWLGGYLARVRRRRRTADILLQPYRGVGWAYSMGIEGFRAGSEPMTISLTIGQQGGVAKVQPYVLPPC
jgi:hypothetical protein